MADSIKLFTGKSTSDVYDINILKESNQQLVNAIATGPQDEFFQHLEECNSCLPFDIEDLAVTPSWNWKPGSLDKVKKYVRSQLQLDKKSSGLAKYVLRTSERGRYDLNWFATKLSRCEKQKRELKKNGYKVDVDIDEYTQKLIDFCNTIEKSINNSFTATNGRVVFTPYVAITPGNERWAHFYLNIRINEGIMNVFQGKEIIQKIPMEGINIVFNAPLRKMMHYLEFPTVSNRSVSYSGIYDSFITENVRTQETNKQVSQHPYIAYPTIRMNMENQNWDIRWGTTCFSNFTDTIQNSFHKLDFTVLAMELIEWSSYYNTEHSNPYNQPTFLHFGMPRKYSKAYQTLMGIDTDSCSRRVKSLLIKGYYAYGTEPDIESKKEVLRHCLNIDCIWQEGCNMNIQFTKQISNISNEEKRCQWESILGTLMDEFTEENLLDIIENELGYYGVYSSDNIINYLLMKDDMNCNAHYYNLFEEVNYWNDNVPVEKASLKVNVELTEAEIKQQMLQWVTEGSVR